MAKDKSTSVVKHDKSTHEILYGDSDVDANLFDDLGDRDKIYEEFGRLTDEVRTFHRNTWEKSQQFVARAMPMLVLAELDAPFLKQLRKDGKKKQAGDISYKPNEPATSTIGKILAYDARRQASVYNKILNKCLAAYEARGSLFKTDQEAVVWCFDYIKSEGGLEAMRRPKKPKKPSTTPTTSSQSTDVQRECWRETGNERVQALPPVGHVTCDFALPHLKLPNTKGSVVVLLGVTDGANVVQIKHVVRDHIVTNSSLGDLGKMTAEDYAIALGQDAVDPLAETLKIDAEDKAAAKAAEPKLVVVA